MRRSMSRMSRTIALHFILILATASAARAQTSTVPERPIFANLDIGVMALALSLIIAGCLVTVVRRLQRIARGLR